MGTSSSFLGCKNWDTELSSCPRSTQAWIMVLKLLSPLQSCLKICISMRRMVPRVNSCLLCQDPSWNEKNICTVPWIKCAVLRLHPQMAITQIFITNRWLQYRSKTQVRVVHLRPTRQSKVISHLHSEEGIKFQSRNDYVFPQSFW